jgi:phage-related protein
MLTWNMGEKWKILYYRSSNGRFPVFDFIEALSSKSKSKVINALDLLEEFGVRLRPPHIKKIEDSGIWELRVLGRGNIRIFYVAVVGRSFLLLHSFEKKKQKTDKKEIKIARERLLQYHKKVIL